MTLLQKVSLACLFGGAAFAIAADTSKSIIPDNVVVCAPSFGCTNKTLFGRSYKVLTTIRFTVMVSVSNEGAYTRADVSIANNTDYSLNVTPEDFRVEVLTPKPRVLLYVPPSNLKDVLPPPPIPSADSPQTSIPPALKEDTDTAQPVPANKASATDQISPETKKKILQDAIEDAAAQKDLPAAPISPNAVTRGRVFFERDKKAQQAKVVIPIAGLVFEFPYVQER